MMSRSLPLILFVLLGGLLAAGLKISDTKTHIPSPLIGRQVPEFNLPVLYEPGRQLSHSDLLGEPYLINFWGSWCPTCIFEHPVITDLARSGRLRIVGFNFRDEPGDAINWLKKHGDPYNDIITALIVDFTTRFTSEELFHQGQKRNLVFLPVNDVSDLLSDPQLEASNFWFDLDHAEAGRLKYPLGVFDSQEVSPGTKPAPHLGQDNEAVYCGDLGLSETELASLRSQGVI